jgi:hypothetical protein
VDPRAALALTAMVALAFVGLFRRRASDHQQRSEQRGPALSGRGGLCGSTGDGGGGCGDAGGGGCGDGDGC